MAWCFDKDELRRSASAQDGVPFETECLYRHEGARFIIDVGTKMDLGHNTVATGVVYFHRFYMFHSFKTFPGHRTGCCCLFLAGKVEETPKKCRDIIKIAKALLTKEKYKTLGSNPKKELMILEKILLQTIKFDLEVNHPYQFLTKYAKCLKGDEAKRTKMVQMAWTFVNDSLCTMLCLQWEPEIIAISLMHLASKLSKFELDDWEGRTSKHSFWWDMFVNGMSIELLESICHQVLDLYSLPSKTAPSSSLALDKSVVPKKIVPPQSVEQKLLLHNMTVEYTLTSKEVMQDVTTKNGEIASTPTASSVKQLLPMPSEINPLPLNSMLSPKTQNEPKPFLPSSSSPTPSKQLEQLHFNKPPLPLSKPPLSAVPSLPPLPSLPPSPPSLLPSPPSAPLSLLMMSQGVPEWPLLPTPPSGFLHPTFPPYPLLQNAAHSFANLMFSQPANLMNEISGQYGPRETMVSMGVHRNSGLLMPPYGECYHPRENRLQQKLQPSPNINSKIQGSYEESRQKNIDTLACNREGAFVRGGYDNGSQHYTDSSRRYSDNGQHYVDGGSQHYPVNQQLRENTPNTQDFNDQDIPPLPGLPRCQNRGVRKRQYREQ